ncbi:MAG TPA: hypothetical protein VFZ69_11260 [Longimicrobiales bacterium]
MEMKAAPDPLDPPTDCCYAAHLLSNGRYSILLSAGGGGFSALDGYALTRWVPDPVCDAAGTHIYVRDLASRVFWTAAGGPAAPRGGHVFRTSGGVAEFDSAECGIECRTTVCVSPQHDIELRRLALRNTGDRTRTLDITTFAEVALNTPAADAAHPGFSRLFVQTAFDLECGALLAWRRARSPQDRPLWFVHRLIDEANAALDYGTDRARFIGRGRDLRAPAAMTGAEPLSGITGSVLDPAFSLRRTVTLEPGASAALAALFAAAESRELALHTLDLFPYIAAIEDAIGAAAPPSRDGVSALGLPVPWRESLRIETGDHADRTVAAPAHVTFPALGTTAAPAHFTFPALGTTASPAHGTSSVPGATAPPAGTERRDEEPLLFFNGWGGFSPDGSEYVIRMPLEDGAPKRPPLPWVNVIANEQAGCIVSESGAIYTWAANSRENRITPWFNDPVTDPHGEAIYVRDDDSRAVWSPTPGPIAGAGGYEVRHGFGCTRFLHESSGLRHDTHVFVPSTAPARIVRLALKNLTGRPRRLTVFGYAQLVLGGHEAETRGRIHTWHAPAVDALMARNAHRSEFGDRVTFLRTWHQNSSPAQPDIRPPAGEITSWTTDRRAFLGARGCTAAPAALRGDGPLDGWTGTGRDICFATATAFHLAPGAEATCVFILGEAADESAASDVIRALGDGDRIDRELDRVRREWLQRVSAVQIRTPSPALDLMVNGWLVYQNLSCRMWARSAYYQSGGAFGFRDQLQDSSALLYVDPAFTRRQILLHAAHQFVEGDVLHWWHPPRSKGIRTRFSDDLLWLPYITAFYIARTGDRAILDEDVQYVRARRLAEDEDEAFLVPDPTGSGSLYEHCCRTIDRSLTGGDHRLPLIGGGDWNDGMNRVGREGRGESVWLGFFLYDILHAFLPLCAARGDGVRVAAYTSCRERLAQALNEGGWDGEWYRRAYYDNGAPLGSAASDECRIDALAQAWAIISGAAPPERATLAIDAMEQHLVDEAAGLIRLLTPPFDRTPNDPGYIKGYLPGIRENGGQYTHGVLWAVRAIAELGRSDRAARLLEMLSPVTRGGTPAAAERYRAEPYVIAADVYGVEPHIGRGGWTWYTGSAGWMYRIALESVLGIELHEGTELRLRPCIPAEWSGYSATFRFGDGTEWRIDVVRQAQSGVAVDGVPGRFHAGAFSVSPPRDGRPHRIAVTLGADYRITYASRLRPARAGMESA